MRRLPIILLATLALGGTAFAEERGASSKSPGHEMHEMQDKGSKAGASGYAPGHEKSETTGTTSGHTFGSSSGTMKSGSGSSQ